MRAVQIPRTATLMPPWFTGTFAIASGNLRGAATAKLLAGAMGKVVKIVESQPGPFLYVIYKNSSIKRFL